MTMVCKKCSRELPSVLIQRLICNGEAESMCPLCALAERNSSHGLPRSEPFGGQIARAMFIDACEHLEITRQPIPIAMRQALAATLALKEKGR